MDEHAQKVAVDFKLNPDQVSVLMHCSQWAKPSKVGFHQSRCLRSCHYQKMVAFRNNFAACAYAVHTRHCGMIPTLI